MDLCLFSTWLTICTHDRGTRRKRNIVFLDEFLVRLVENLDKLSLCTHCQDKILSFSNAVTYNTYDGTIKGKFDSTGATLLSMCGFLSIHTNVFLLRKPARRGTRRGNWDSRRGTGELVLFFSHRVPRQFSWWKTYTRPFSSAKKLCHQVSWYILLRKTVMCTRPETWISPLSLSFL